MQGAQITIWLAADDDSEEMAAVHVFANGAVLQDGNDELVGPLLRRLRAVLAALPAAAGDQDEAHGGAVAL